MPQEFSRLFFPRHFVFWQFNFPRLWTFLKNIFFLSFFSLKDSSFWLSQSSCNIFPCTEGFNKIIERNKLWLNMKTKNKNQYFNQMFIVPVVRDFKFDQHFDFRISATLNSCNFFYKVTQKLHIFFQQFLLFKVFTISKSMFQTFFS